MSWFWRLQSNAISTEDYFTEILVFLLSYQPELLGLWMQKLGIPPPGTSTGVEIASQVAYPEGRPDIVMQYPGDAGDRVVMIESKIGSSEGPSQLNRYANILTNHFANADQRYLVFVTRDHEPKDRRNILKGIPRGQVHFIQSHWYEFYEVLMSLDGNTDHQVLLSEVAAFMKEKGMAQQYRLTTIDLLTISNLGDLIGKLENTLDGEVKNRFGEILGSTRLTDLRKHKTRFALEKFFKTGDKTWYCGLGYYFVGNAGIDFPVVRLNFGADRNISNRNILNFLHEISERPGWTLEEQPHWLSAFHQESLENLLSSQAGVSALKEFFLGRLEELMEIKTQYPGLPWD